MKNWRRAFCSDMARCFHAPRFALAVMMIAGIRILGVVQEIRLVGQTNVLYLHHVGEFGIATIFLGPLVYSTAFVSDYQNRFTPYCVKRSSVAGYAWGKICCAALGGAAATALGLLIFYLLLAVRFPLVEADSMLETLSDVAPFGALLLGAHPFAYFAAMTLLDALRAAVLAASAVFVSCLIPNVFVALCSPILVYYLAVNAFPYGWLSPYRVLVTASVDMGGVGASTLYAVGYALLWVALMGAAFCHGVRRRVEHG